MTHVGMVGTSSAVKGVPPLFISFAGKMIININNNNSNNNDDNGREHV